MSTDRGEWKSKLGFVLAASGSAIGLGNIVFFSANAYTFGAGAFYLPYLASLFVIGIPLLVAEMALGGLTRTSFPLSLRKVGGRVGEFCGWWGLTNALFITMYYVTILAWVCGMLLGSFGGLWEPASAVPAFGLDELANPAGFFFQMISSWPVLGLVVLVWVLNLLIVRRGVATIEPVVKIFVPTMWIFMIFLIVRGLTLPYGEQGVWLLFTPDFAIAKDPAVWQGAMSQIFFSLTLGFGVMTAYASYLPKGSDHVNNGIVTACLNCGFEFIAGLAVFSLLFAFAVIPRASTLAMMFFVVPQGIGAMPVGSQLYGLLFFFLLLIAGLSSSISLLEALCSALIDKFRWSRRRTLTVTALVGLTGSLCFALPMVIDSQLASNGTVGLTLLDLVDHWAFSYGLLIVGLVESLLLGWALPASKLRMLVNEHTKFRIPAACDWLLKVVIPGAIAVVLGSSIWSEITGGLYGTSFSFDWGAGLPWVALMVWLGATLIGSWLLTSKPGTVS